MQLATLRPNLSFFISPKGQLSVQEIRSQLRVSQLQTSKFQKFRFIYFHKNKNNNKEINKKASLSSQSGREETTIPSTFQSRARSCRMLPGVGTAPSQAPNIEQAPFLCYEWQNRNNIWFLIHSNSMRLIIVSLQIWNLSFLIKGKVVYLIILYCIQRLDVS